MRADAQSRGGFVQIGGSFGSTAEVKDAWTPNHDLFEEASQYLWRRFGSQGSKSEVERIVKAASDQVTKGLAECESPLEKRILPFLVCQDYLDLSHDFASVHLPKIEPMAPGIGVYIVPQMALFRFRADFGLVAVKNNIRHIVIVECDGRGYHDPRQDALRDSYFASWGIPTVRAPGKQVYSEVRAFAQRAADALIELTKRGNAS